MYADQFAQSLASIVNDGRKKPLFDPEDVARKIRDSITGFQTSEDEEEEEEESEDELVSNGEELEEGLEE